MHYHPVCVNPSASSRSHRLCRNMNKISSSKSFDVFNFNDEDGLPDFPDQKHYNKFSADTSPVLKYRLLELVSGRGNDQPKEVREAPSAVVDAADSDPSSDNDIRLANSTKDRRNLHFGADSAKSDIVLRGASLTRNDLILESPSTSNPSRDEWDHHVQTGYQKPISIFCEPAASDPCSGNGRLTSAILESQFSNESDEIFTDDDENMTETSSLTRLSNEHGYNFDEETSDYRLGGCEVDNYGKTIHFSPDYVALGDEYSTNSHLVFTSSLIQLEYSDCTHGTRVFQWAIDDIIDIESQWYGRIETVVVTLHVISKEASLVNNNTYNISGVKELKFALVEPNWPEKLDEIKSLNLTYNARWNIELDNSDENNLLGQNNDFSQEHYFPSFNVPFEVVYPKGDIDAVSISNRDVELLKPDTFINDTIIDFYIKFLMNKIHPEAKHRFHFFNSFFFRKLADLDKDPSSASDGRTAFLRVRKWTRKVNLFEKDFIFIPVNFSFHWSLIVICHAGEVINFEDKNIRKSYKVPCILHMDSIKGSHAGLKDIIQSYLWEEWKEKHKEASEDLSLKFSNLRFVSLELPQQENSFDCGLFLLHYAEHFLEEAPINFNPFKLTKFSKFLSANWFPPSVVSLKRTLIQRLIYELLRNQSEEAIDNCINEQLPQNNGNETGVEFLGEGFSPKKAFPANLSTSQDGRGIEMTLLPTSPLRNPRCIRDSDIVFREFFDSGDANGTLFRTVSTMSPILEEDKGVEQLEYSISIDGGGYEQVPEYISEPSNLTQLCNDSFMDQHNDKADDPVASQKSLDIGFPKKHKNEADDPVGSQKSLDFRFSKITSQWKGPDPNTDSYQGAQSLPPGKNVHLDVQFCGATGVTGSDPDQCLNKKPGSVLEKTTASLASNPDEGPKKKSMPLSPEIVCSNDSITPKSVPLCQNEPLRSPSFENMNHLALDPASPSENEQSYSPQNMGHLTPDPVAPCENHQHRSPSSNKKQQRHELEEPKSPSIVSFGLESPPPDCIIARENEKRGGIRGFTESDARCGEERNAKRLRLTLHPVGR